MNKEDKIHINSFKFYDRDELEELTKQYYLENKELKKQLEKKYEKLGTLIVEILYEENTRLPNEITVLKTENQKSKEMQREFIKYLEDYIEVLKSQQENVNGLDILEEETLFILEETLEKYKEIIGGKNKWKNG